MSDPTNPDRVPLDRPPVPRFSPLPDLPDLPEMPRGVAPTPSVPIPAPPPPMASLPAPRVVVDLPRPSPSVTIDAPPRPAPRATMPKPPEPTPPAPTPAPQGRWVGEALSTLVRPTKSKATVLAAAGSLVAGAFGLQLLVGSGPPSTPPTAKTVVAKAAEVPPPEPPAAEPEKPGEFAMPPLPTPTPAETPAVVAAATWPDPIPLPRPPEGSPTPVRVKPVAMFPPPPDVGIVVASAQSPAGPVVPTLPELPATPAAPLPVQPAPAAPVTLPTPAAPVTLPKPVPTPIPAPPPPTPIPAAPESVKVAPVTLPTDVPKSVALPVLPPKPIEVSPSRVPVVNPFETPQPATPAFVDVTPVAPAPTPPAPVAPLKPAFTPIEPTPEPRRIPPTPVPASGAARTDFDVDLHPAQAGQTYEAVSKQHYGDAKYADALRSFNKNRDPGRDELQIPPTDALRKLAAAGRTPAVNPIAPAGGESWAPPAALGGSKPVAGRSYTVTQDGTTFRDLAGTLLNDRTKYRRISDLNSTIDPNAKLQKGDKVAVP